ncbi:hypothetical protein GOBAR_DD33900 [Gossypium barbadense]|nr:hypothetical protein GOBAR_DD33900 [Gossypium barbadense]
MATNGAIAEACRIEDRIHIIDFQIAQGTKDMLDVKLGKALAVKFPLQLHYTPDESVDVNNLRDGILRMVRSLSPKVITLVEQESNTKIASFLPKFIKTLEDIINVIACEGNERVERHELFGKWKSRLTMAGFRSYPVSFYINSMIRGLLKCYSKHYTLVEKDEAMLLGWKDRNLISTSAWCCDG